MAMKRDEMSQPMQCGDEKRDHSHLVLMLIRVFTLFI